MFPLTALIWQNQAPDTHQNMTGQMAVDQAQLPAFSKTESKTIHSNHPTHNQAEMTANNFGQVECPDSQMEGQEPQEDSLELSASPQALPTYGDMTSNNPTLTNDPVCQMAKPNCHVSQYPIVQTPNLITPLNPEAAQQCDQTLSAYAEEPKFPVPSSQQYNAQQQSF